MCSRYEISTTARDIMAALSLTTAPPLPNKAEMRPTDNALIVGADRIGRLLPWGLAVEWSKQPMINARAETLSEKPTFRPLLETRCVVPASAYFEWRKTDDGRKLKNRIAARRQPMAFAGLTDGTRFTVVTCAPSPAIAHIHNRMPVILSGTGIDAWLGPAPFAEVRGALTPYPDEIDFTEETPPAPAQGSLFG